MVRIGIVGLGFMGMIHYLAAQDEACGSNSVMQSRCEKAGRRLARRPWQFRPARRNDGPGRRQTLSCALPTCSPIPTLI